MSFTNYKVLTAKATIPAVWCSKAVCYCVYGPGGRATPEERSAAVERAKLLAKLVEEPKRLWTSEEDVFVPVRMAAAAHQSPGADSTFGCSCHTHR